MALADTEHHYNYRLALRAIGPGPACGAYTLATICAAFAVPSLLFCGWLSQQQIAITITLATLVSGLALLIFSWRLERITPLARRVDDLFLSGVFVLSAGMLWCVSAAAQGRGAGSSLEAGPTVAIILITVAIAVGHVHRRALLLVMLGSLNHLR
jgi:hypothetical protein